MIKVIAAAQKKNHSGCYFDLNRSLENSTIFFLLENSVYSSNKEATIVYNAKPIESCAYILKEFFLITDLGLCRMQRFEKKTKYYNIGIFCRMQSFGQLTFLFL